LLDPDNTSVTLYTLQRAAVVGRELRLETLSDEALDQFVNGFEIRQLGTAGGAR
jgi:hypothetical protein